MFIRRNSLPKFSNAWRKVKPSRRFADLDRKYRGQWSDELAELADGDLLDPQVRRVKFDIKKWLMSKQCFDKRDRGAPGLPLTALYSHSKSWPFRTSSTSSSCGAAAWLISICCAHLVTGSQRYTRSS